MIKKDILKSRIRIAIELLNEIQKDLEKNPKSKITIFDVISEVVGVLEGER